MTNDQSCKVDVAHETWGWFQLRPTILQYQFKKAQQGEFIAFIWMLSRITKQGGRS